PLLPTRFMTPSVFVSVPCPSHRKKSCARLRRERANRCRRISPNETRCHTNYQRTRRNDFGGGRRYIARSPAQQIQTLECAGELRCWGVRDLHRLARRSARQLMLCARGARRRSSNNDPRRSQRWPVAAWHSRSVCKRASLTVRLLHSRVCPLRESA